jgi:hypothetical protein
MKSMQWKLENGMRALFNLDRIDAVIEHGSNPKSQTIIVIGGEEWTVIGTYDDIVERLGGRYQ